MTKKTLGIIGVGAFGAFMAKHLAAHFSLVLYDTQKSAARGGEKYGAVVNNLKEIAACKMIVLAVPVQHIEDVLRQLAPLVQSGTLMLDVASVKIKPTQLMKKILPQHVDIVGTHPLFGPQSGKNGIKGLKIAVCNIRGKRAVCVSRFLRKTLKLNVQLATAETHDRELAYVQGLTHLLMKVIVALDLPKFRLTTKTYEHLDAMVEMIRYDSEELFRAIERENPFSMKAKKSFFAAARQLEKKLSRG